MITPFAVLDKFKSIGGTFHPQSKNFIDRVRKIKTLILDWDGVFNMGYKNRDFSEGFNEIDSMGVNLLRFAFWQKTGTVLPIVIISGQNNNSIHFFAERENINYIYSGYKNKTEAFNEYCNKINLNHDYTAFIFDDILDFSIAKACGIRILINRESNPLMNEYADKKYLYDYKTANSCNNFGVREATELLASLISDFERLIDLRVSYDKTYIEYMTERKKIRPELIQS